MTVQMQQKSRHDSGKSDGIAILGKGTGSQLTTMVVSYVSDFLIIWTPFLNDTEQKVN